MSSSLFKLLIAGLLIVGLVAWLFWKFPQLPQKISPKLIPSPQPKQLTLADISKLLKATPSAEVDKQILDAVEKVGQEGSSIILNDCDPEPSVLKLTSSDLTINNSGKQEVKIVGIPQLKQNLSAGVTVSVKIEPALYPYSCQLIATSSATPQIRGLIYFPQSQMATGIDMFKKQAVEVNILSLASCKSDQKVIKIKKGDHLTFKNNGQERERIYLSDVWDFNLEIDSENTQPVNLKEGMYTISCQSKTSDFIQATTIFVD